MMVSSFISIATSFVCFFITKILLSPLIKKRWGVVLYDACFFLQQITIFLSMMVLLSSNFLFFTMTGEEHLKYIVLLSLTLAYGYYVTFHGIILTFFERKFHNLLSTRYKIEARTTLDGALYCAQNGSIMYHIAFLIETQLSKAKKVVFPIGGSFLLLVVLGLMYIPLIWIKGLFWGCLLAVVLSIIPWIYFIPLSDYQPQADKQLLIGHFIRCSPAFIFPIVFTISTPFLIDSFVDNNDSNLFLTYI